MPSRTLAELFASQTLHSSHWQLCAGRDGASVPSLSSALWVHSARVGNPGHALRLELREEEKKERKKDEGK